MSLLIFNVMELFRDLPFSLGCHYPKIFTITNLYHHNKSQFVPIYNVTKNISHNKGNTNVTTRPKGNSPRLYRQNYSKNPRAPCK